MMNAGLDETDRSLFIKSQLLFTRTKIRFIAIAIDYPHIYISTYTYIGLAK